MAQILAHAPSADSLAAQLPRSYRGLHDITGRRFAYTWFVDTMAVMPWIERQIASRFDCETDDVSLFEDEDGHEMAVVAGRPVAFVAYSNEWRA